MDYRFPKDLKNTTALSLKETHLEKSNEFAEIGKHIFQKIVEAIKLLI